MLLVFFCVCFVLKNYLFIIAFDAKMVNFQVRLATRLLFHLDRDYSHFESEMVLFTPAKNITNAIPHLFDSNHHSLLTPVICG